MAQTNYTIKAQEAIADASREAQKYNHTLIDEEHLFTALLDQKEGVIPPLMDRLGVQRGQLRDDLTALLKQKPRAYGDNIEVSASPALRMLFRLAEQEASNLKDEYVSTEHLLIAMAGGNGGGGNLLKKHGITKDGILQALVSIRGSQRVTSENPENQYQVLERYCRDLTVLARQEKLDPVIGRG